jgi:folate-binding protein YgfZ
MTDSSDNAAPRFSRLDHLGLIAFEGTDAPAFLNGQLTSDVQALTPERCQYGGYCTAKGRLLATFLLWRRERSFYLQLPAVLREPVQRQLSKFILRSKVTASDASGAWVRFGTAGGNVESLLGRIFGAVPAAPGEVQHVTDATVIKLPVDRYEIAVPAAGAGAFEEALVAHGFAPSGAELWQRLDIRAGVPLITPATQEEFVPQMVNLDLIGGVSFSKGCYPGQEIVARMHYLGRVKQRMYRFHADSRDAPRPAEKLYSAAFGDQACGTIVDAAPAPESGYDALAVVQIDQARDDNLHLRAADGPVLKLLELPYPVAA